jgi:hypothetical protein
MPFQSDFSEAGALTFPHFSGVRVMMMPVLLEDATTVPIKQWREPFRQLVEMSPVRKGTAYLTIDEALVDAGETHRRPGLHVDGIGPDGREAGWGGGGGWGSGGMLVAANVTGCRAWAQNFDGYPHANGDCEHLREQLGKPRQLHENRVYMCGPLTVHEAIPMRRAARRSFVRLSMPNDCPWYEGYSRNPLGIEPTGPVHSARTEFMAYRRAA